ncbi:chemotaxis protein CheC [Pseudomonas sp. 5P_3.1_Bac2]|uniref:chemotaxis protein CheC n=1 Tax=Pseudomonas sp. 5P_3.1_Bac2 TaxID=2971617 RepID=UPI0021C946AE|nr:chemotaxis protein CheC [Pseudomonas sp. 5P_3.1_Bac2]MCU1719415.1 chemotaxis protein CheC [Pseudomonas sp. 5P_3.1_Bac2]
MLKLTSLQTDLLCELFNIGIGRAAAAMSEMLQDEVLLSVPEVHFITVSEVTDHLGKRSRSMYCIRQPFNGTFSGNALLIFPEDKSLEMVKVLIGDIPPGTELLQVQRDALLEVGNVVLNACLASLSEMTNTPFECSLPTVDSGDTRRVLGTRVQNHVVLLIHIRFALKTQNIEGFVVFVMNSTSYEDMLNAVNRFIAKIG